MLCDLFKWIQQQSSSFPRCTEVVIYDDTDGIHETLEMIAFLSFTGRSVWEAALIPCLIKSSFYGTVNILKNDWM